MKKNLIVLALLAAAGAASAQSSVTLYGVVDASVGSLKDTLSATSTKITNRQNVVESSGMRNSRWGIKGSEDLGNGLKANFVLEQGINMDKGSVANTSGSADGFNREANVGLSGNFGEVKLGRVYSAYDSLRALTNNTADHNVAVTRDVWNTSGKGDYAIRFNNAIRFDSATYNGFSGALAYGLGENKNAAGNLNQDATDNIALHVKYVNGPLAVGYAHQTEEQLAGVASTKYNLLGASYDFGVAKLTGSYNKVKAAASAEDTEYQLGVSAPVGPVVLFAGYAHAKAEVAGVKTGESNGYDLLAVYSLSKRTDLYTGYKSVTDKAAAGVKEGEKKQFAVGVRHAF
ncbi:MAG: porin [Burkholderiales bacterium]|nr:porin [Burkholderiales bacterium]